MKAISLLKISFIAALCLTFASCDKGVELPWEPGQGTHKPGTGNNGDNNEDNPTPPENKPDNSKPRYVWIDAAGNFEQFANSEENIKTELEKIKNVGFTDIVVDVRPTTGDVLFKTSNADPVKRMDCWKNGRYFWIDRTADFDYLQVFVEEGHRLGLKVNVTMNTFVGGYLCPYGLGNEGMLYRDASKKKWASVINASNGLTNTMDLQNDEEDWGAKFLSPANDEVQEYLLNIIGDVAKYDLDGIILDRCRFDDYQLMSDFSESARTKFEQFIGKSVKNFPADIMEPGTEYYVDNTSLAGQWMSFRAKTIHDFIEKAAARVKSVNKKIRFGVYVGAWYEDYYRSGVNWASPKYNPSNDYGSWLQPDYKNYGYADHLDFIFLGAYAAVDSIHGNSEWTVEGFCKLGGQKIMGEVPFCGGPDIGNGTGWDDGGKNAELKDAIDVCINSCDGGMFLFDLCHIRMYNYWTSCKQAIDKYLKSVN